MTQRKPSILSSIIGVIGELLITAGVLIGLFIVWQVWYTDIGANRYQAQEVTQIQEAFGEAPTGIGERHYEDPEIGVGTPVESDALGVIHIPAFGYDYQYSVKEGTGLREVLDLGNFGHYEGTALPGQVGNFSLAAHRQTYGAPMKNVDQLETGDAVIIETADKYLVYRIIDEEIVQPNAIRVVSADPFQARRAEEISGISVDGRDLVPSHRYLTITTCHPPFISNERWIIHAELDHWVDRADGVPVEMIDPADIPDNYDGPEAISRTNISDRTVETGEAALQVATDQGIAFAEQETTVLSN